MDDFLAAINALKRLKRKWDWLLKNHREIAEIAELSVKVGRPKKEHLKTTENNEVEPIGKYSVRIFCAGFKARYGTNPVITPHHAKLLKGLGEQVGRPQLEEFVSAFFKMNDQWFIKRSHDVPTLVGNINKVQVFLKRGKLQTSHQAAEAERLSANAQVLEEAFRGKE